MVFQDPYASLNPRHSVGRIVGEPLRVHGSRIGARRARAVRELLEHRRPARRRRAPLPARVLRRPAPAHRHRPRARAAIPTSSSPTSRSRRSTSRSRRRSSTCSRTCRSEFDLTYLFIAHDLAVVRHISDRIAVMYLGRIVEISPADELYDEPAAPVHDLAAVGGADPRSGRRAEAQADPARRRSAQPREPAGRLPLPHALPVRAADALPRGSAAAAQVLHRPRGRVSLGGGDQGGRHQAARARGRARGCPAQSRWKSRRQTENRVALRAARRAAQAAGGAVNVPDHEQCVVDVLGGEVVGRRAVASRQDLRRPRARAPSPRGSVRTAATRPPATKTPRETGLGGGYEQAAACVAQLVEAAKGTRRSVQSALMRSRRPGCVLVAPALGKVTQACAQRAAARARTLELLRRGSVERPAGESRARAAADRAERRRRLRADDAVAAPAEIDVAVRPRRCARWRPDAARVEAAAPRAPPRPRSRSTRHSIRVERERAPPRRRVAAGPNGSTNEGAHAGRARGRRIAPGRGGRGRDRRPATSARRRRAVRFA